jgi:hypothetical protein
MRSGWSRFARGALSLVAFTLGCTAVTPAGAKVAVYQAPLDAPPAANRMPAGCVQVARGKPAYWSELQMASYDPYRVERNRTGSVGANVLLVLSRMLVPRLTGDCAAASPITDCPPLEGAWFELEFVSYACSSEGLAWLPPENLNSVNHVP